MTWIDVQSLRKSGRFQEAIGLGLHHLADDPEDFKVRTQVDWAFYGEIKGQIAAISAKLKAAQPVPPPAIDKVYQELRRFAKQPKRRQDNALSNILRELSKIAQHFHAYPGFVRWVGIDSLAAEDWQYSQLDGNRYPPLALGVARGLAKWVKANPQAEQEDIKLALEWSGRVRPTAEGDDALWLDWDRVILLRRSNHHEEAARILSSVIKAKRNDFWVWAEAARLYASEQPGLAIACACRALECGSDPKFTVNVHRELAQLLAEQGEFCQASLELGCSLAIRQEQGWGIDAGLQQLINSDWYDPSSSGGENQKAYYARHSQDALALCFDSVKAKPATYLGTITPLPPKDAHPGWKPRPLPRFAVRDEDGESISIVSPGMRTSSLAMGDPVILIIGKQQENSRETIVQLSARSQGVSWDCTDSGNGAVTQAGSDGKRTKVFVDRDSEIAINDDTWVGSRPPSPGDGVVFRTTLNRKTGRRDLFAVEPGPLPTTDVRIAKGRIKRSSHGFGFVDDVFVTPYLIERLPSDTNDVSAVAVYSKHPKEDRYGWRAVVVNPE